MTAPWTAAGRFLLESVPDLYETADERQLAAVLEPAIVKIEAEAAAPYLKALERLDQFATDKAYAADDWVWTPEGERELWNIVTEARALLEKADR